MTILFDKNKNALISENRAFFVRDRSRLTSTEQSILRLLWSDFFAQEGMTRTAVGLEQRNVIAVETGKAVLRAYPYLSVIVLEKTPDTVVWKSVACGHLP